MPKSNTTLESTRLRLLLSNSLTLLRTLRKRVDSIRKRPQRRKLLRRKLLRKKNQRRKEETKLLRRLLLIQELEIRLLMPCKPPKTLTSTKVSRTMKDGLS